MSTTRNPWVTVPEDDLPANVCPTCRVAWPVDRMPHGGCEGWDR